MIRLEHINRTFTVGDELVHGLDDVSLQIKDGDYVSIMGPSGSGKSTLLNVLGLLDQPDSGNYFLNGDDVTINGVPFDSTGYIPGGYPNGDTHITTNNWALLSAGGWVGFHNVSPTQLITDAASWNLAKHFAFAPSGALALQLFGLTPYSSNTLSIYAVGWDASGSPGNFSSSYGGAITDVEMNKP